MRLASGVSFCTPTPASPPIVESRPEARPTSRRPREKDAFIVGGGSAARCRFRAFPVGPRALYQAGVDSLQLLLPNDGAHVADQRRRLARPAFERVERRSQP